jgi:hypothetical protein
MICFVPRFERNSCNSCSFTVCDRLETSCRTAEKVYKGVIGTRNATMGIKMFYILFRLSLTSFIAGRIKTKFKHITKVPYLRLK